MLSCSLASDILPKPTVKIQSASSTFPISTCNMSVTENLRFLLVLLFAGCVAADTGDDFSNNLFSDLAPYVLQPTFLAHVLIASCTQSAGALRRTGHDAIHEPVDGLG